MLGDSSPESLQKGYMKEGEILPHRPLQNDIYINDKNKMRKMSSAHD